MKFTDLSLPLAALVFAAMISSCANPSASDRAAARQRADNSSELAVSQPVTNSYEIADSVVHAAAPAAAAPAAAQEGKGDAVKGKEVFDQCAICHNVDSDEEKMGPALKGLFKKPKLKNGSAANEPNVRTIIKAGGNGMPGYEELLSAEEMDNLVAYLKTV